MSPSTLPTVYAVGYVKGSRATYAGLTVKGGAFGSNSKFNTGSLAGDLAAAYRNFGARLVALRKSGTQNLQLGNSLLADTTVEDAISDYAGTVGSASIPIFTSGPAVPTITPASGSVYLRTGGSSLGTSLYVYNGSVWTAVAGV